MKTFAIISLAVGVALTSRADTEMESVQKELSLTRAKLELAQAKLQLVAAQAAVQQAAIAPAPKKPSPRAPTSSRWSKSTKVAGPATPAATTLAAPVKEKPAPEQPAAPTDGTAPDQGNNDQPPVDPLNPSGTEVAKVDKKGSDLFFHTGTRLLAPFKVDPATGVFSTSDSKLSEYLEVDYGNIWAWQPDRVKEALSDQNPHWKDKMGGSSVDQSVRDRL